MDFTKTIIPLALMASESIAHSAIDSEPIRAREIIILLISRFQDPLCKLRTEFPVIYSRVRGNETIRYLLYGFLFEGPETSAGQVI